MAKKLHKGMLAPYDEPFHFIRLGKFTVINKTAKTLKITVYGFKITIEEAEKETDFWEVRDFNIQNLSHAYWDTITFYFFPKRPQYCMQALRENA